MGTKIATCNYCGTRAALVFDRGRHELACRACGAPLHEMKAMPLPEKPARKREAPGRNPRVTGKGRPVRVRDDDDDHDRGDRDRWRKQRKPRRRRRKPVLRKIAEEVWDLFEDIID